MAGIIFGWCLCKLVFFDRRATFAGEVFGFEQYMDIVAEKLQAIQLALYYNLSSQSIFISAQKYFVERV
ncbi:hypothetical protein CLJ08_02270 [Pseudomonas mosselii]|nr:hypothetical protein CLJ08_02270 [Pseudomonas mosselii]